MVFMQTLGPFQGFFMGKGRQKGVPGAGQGANGGLPEAGVGQNTEGQTGPQILLSGRQTFLLNPQTSRHQSAAVNFYI